MESSEPLPDHVKAVIETLASSTLFDQLEREGITTPENYIDFYENLTDFQKKIVSYYRVVIGDLLDKIKRDIDKK